MEFVYIGGLAQMVERSLSMREVPGSIPGSSNFFLSLLAPFLFTEDKDEEIEYMYSSACKY